jgi:aldehyde dehydrogenase (NAD+)
VKVTAKQMEGTRQLFYAGGKWREPASGEYLASFDPATGAPWYEQAACGRDDIDAAVAAARSALGDPAWRTMTQTDRGRLLFRLADLVTAHAPELAELECRDIGKLLKETSALAVMMAETLRYWGGMADKIQGETIPINKPDMLSFTRREPIGVVAAIVPWNSPLYVLGDSLAPALAIGNALIVKPSEHAAASALALAELVEEAGYPAGVYNVVTGLGDVAGEPLTRHVGVDKIVFTGGSATGRRVAAAAASHLVSCNLELGGKSPNVIFADANLDRAESGIVAGIFAASGQSCVAGSRIFVQEGVYDEVLDRLVAAAREIRVGHPVKPDTQLGPIALKEQLEKVERYIKIGRHEGARLVAGGQRPEGHATRAGWYFEPTVFADVDNAMRIAQEEIFGPVASVIKFSSEAELIRLANATPFGLASGIWTSDIDKALRFAERIDAGTVWINTYRSLAHTTPFGGFKQSGYGKLRGLEAIREFTRTKSVIVDYSGQSQDPFVPRT